jgi:hypothetical protein
VGRRAAVESKAWLVRPVDGMGADPEDWTILHALTAGHARAFHASNLGIDFTDVRVTRYPALDAKPITDWSLMMVADFWVECARCYQRIEKRDYDFDGDMPFRTTARGGATYCSEACLIAREWRDD